MLQFHKSSETNGQFSLSRAVTVYTNIKVNIAESPSVLQCIESAKEDFEYSRSIRWPSNVRSSLFNSCDQKEKFKKTILPLQEQLKEDVEAYLKFLSFDDNNYEWKYKDAWGNKYTDYEFQETHSHIDPLIKKDTSKFNILSLIYYPEKNDSHVLVFESCLPQNLELFYKFPTKVTTPLNTDDPTSIFSEKYMVIIFPSFLRHSVKFIKESNKERFSISMNITANEKNIV